MQILFSAMVKINSIDWRFLEIIEFQSQNESMKWLLSTDVR